MMESFASSPSVRARMQRQRRQHTSLEVDLRRALHQRGLRYRVQVPVLHRRTADIVFTRARVIVDARSCFWHRCPKHGSIPKSNSSWWITKLERTVSRDVSTVQELCEAGWEVVVVWEHDDIEQSAELIERLVRSR